MIGIVLFVYAYMKFSKVYFYGGTTIFTHKVENFFDYNHTFSADDGMQFAFGIVDRSGKRLDDPAYGEIVARYETWGLQENSEDHIPLKRCSMDEIGLGDPEKSLFYPTVEKNKDQIRYYN